MKKILLRGYYGFNNFGDDALLYSIINNIFEDRDKFKITVLSKDIDTNNNNADFVKNKKMNMLKEIMKTDVLVFGGGSQFQDFGTLNSKKELLFKLGIILFAKVTRKKVIHLGISVGPLKTKLGKKLGIMALFFSDYIGVRDKQSYEFLCKEIKGNKNNIYAPDLTFLLKPEKTYKNKKENPIVLGVNVLPFDKTTKANSTTAETVLNDIKLALNEIVNNKLDIRIKLFAFQNSSNLSDLESLKKIASLQSEYIVYEGDIGSFIKEIDECTHFITMRFHAAVFANMYNIPQINLAYHQKCLNFMEEYNYHSDSVIDINYNENSKIDYTFLFNDLLENNNKYLPSIDNQKDNLILEKMKKEIMEIVYA